MKKALSLILSVLMLAGLFVMPVYADESNGFNDGKLNWNEIKTVNLTGLYAPIAGETLADYSNRGEEPTTDPALALTAAGWDDKVTDENYVFEAGQVYTLYLFYGEEENDVVFDKDCAVTVDNGTLNTVLKIEGKLCVAIDFTIPEAEPIPGTIDNPIYVAMGKSAPTSLQLKAGESIYYQLKPQVFNGYSLIVEDMEARIAYTVDGVRYDHDNAWSPIDWGIKAVLEFTPLSAGIVCFTNESDADMEEPVTVTWKMPLGTESDPQMLEDGANEVSIPLSYPVYYASYVPVSVGEHVLSVSDYENFMITLDVDGDPATTEDQFSMTEDYVLNVEESYVPIFFIVQPIGTTPDVTLTVTPPAKGTEQNPYYLGTYEEVLAGVNYADDAMWPATADGIYYTMDGYSFDNTTLKVTGQAPLTVTVNGETWTVAGTGTVTKEIALKLVDDQYSFLVKIQSSADVKLDVVYPVGSFYNPLELNKGKNTLPLDDLGNFYYAIYTAEQDGVLVMTPNTVEGLGYAEAVNQTLKEDGSYDSDFIYAGWYDDDGVLQGASDDNVLKVPVKKGDQVLVTANAGENEDFEILAMDWVLNVAYDLAIVTQPANSQTKNGETAKVKIEAVGEGLTYQWYIKNAGSKKYSKSSIKTNTYSVKMSSTSRDRYVYCVVKDKYGKEVKSKTIVLRMAASITKESATATYVKMKAKGTVKVTALGDGLTYTWYVKDTTSDSYVKSSITKSSYSVTMSSKTKGRKLYCIVKDKYGNTVQSKTFLFREAVSITTQPKTVTVKKNATAKVTVKASGDGLKYTWYVKNASSSKYSKSSITKSTYSVKMTSKVKNRKVYCVVKDKYGKTVKTVTVTLKMK